MGQGIGEVLTFAVGVAISPLPIIAVILMLFSRRAKVNGAHNAAVMAVLFLVFGVDLIAKGLPPLTS
jgi:Na+/phosphate symporter